MEGSFQRFSWALRVLDVQPAERLLEVGCGSGILAAELAARLKKGKITAVDRSTAFISKAIARNQENIRNRVALFLEGDIRTLRLAGKTFDKIFALNVSVFWLQPETSLQAIQKVMHPQSLFYLFYQPPNAGARRIALQAEEALRRNQFIVLERIIEPLIPFEAFALIARRSTES